MKNLLLSSFALLVILLSSSCFKGNTNTDPNGCTNDSNGYISAKINGKSYNSNSNCDLAQYSKEDGSSSLLLGDFSKYSTSLTGGHIDKLLYLYLISYNEEIEAGCVEYLNGEQISGENNFYPFLIFYFEDFNYSIATNSGKGYFSIDLEEPVKICIDRIDGTKGKIQGTFSFTMKELVDENPGILKVTDGKFDFELK